MTAPSLNEIAKRMSDAARGAGWPLGLAQDLGQAAAWLSSQGGDGVGVAMAALGAKPDPVEARQDTPGDWQIGLAPAGVAGPAALDLVLAGEGPVSLALTDAPDLVLALAGYASAQTGQTLVLSGALTATVTSGALEGAPHRAPEDKILRLSLGAPGVIKPAVQPRRAPDDATWAQAGALAAKTLVPATAQSRAFGAGAGAVDGDD